MSQAAIELAAGIPLLKTLGIWLVESGDNHAVMEVEVDDRHLQLEPQLHPWRPCQRPTVGRSQILHLGRRIASLSVTIHNGHNQLLAHGTSTIIVLVER